MVSSVLLYAAPVWSLRYLDVIEKAQMNFFKRLLCLPANTPNWNLRLELGIVHIAHKAMKLTWNWFIKILELPEYCIPKLCMLRLIALANDPIGATALNWASQFKEFLVRMNCEDLWASRDPTLWSSRTDAVSRQYELELRMADVARSQVSRACQLNIPRDTNSGLAKYSTLKLPFYIKRAIAQLRLSSQYNAKITLPKCAGKLNPHAICENCNLREEETLIHFFFNCPLYTPHRTHYITREMRGAGSKAALELLLFSVDSDTLKAVYFFVQKSLMLRAFSLNI